MSPKISVSLVLLLIVRECYWCAAFLVSTNTAFSTSISKTALWENSVTFPSGELGRTSSGSTRTRKSLVIFSGNLGGDTPIVTPQNGETYFSKVSNFFDDSNHPNVRFLRDEIGLKDLTATVVSRYPNLLNRSVDRNLRPKAQYLEREWRRNAADEIRKNPRYLSFSLINRIIPRHQFSKYMGFNDTSFGVSALLVPGDEDYCSLVGSPLSEYRNWRNANSERYLQQVFSSQTFEDISNQDITSNESLQTHSKNDFADTFKEQKQEGSLENNEIKTLRDNMSQYPQLMSLNREQQTTLEWLVDEVGVSLDTISKNPQILSNCVKSKLLPTLNWLLNAGITSEAVSKCPNLLWLSVQNNLEPTFTWLREEAGIKVEVVRKNPQLLLYSVENKLEPTLNHLLEIGITHSAINKQPGLLWKRVDTTQQKIDYLRTEVGLLDETAKVISACPSLLSCSVESNLRPKVEYLRKEMGRDVVSEIIKFPVYLQYSLKNRIIPRYQYAKDKGHEPKLNINKLLAPNDDEFCRRLGSNSEHYHAWKKDNSF